MQQLQSNQLKTCKIYKYSSANANFSKSSHKGHKTKGQILKPSNDSFWIKPSEILAFTAMFRIYCIPWTLSTVVVTQLLTFLDYLGNSKLFELYLFYHHSHRNAENVEKTNLVPADDLVEYHFLGSKGSG